MAETALAPPDVPAPADVQVLSDTLGVFDATLAASFRALGCWLRHMHAWINPTGKRLYMQQLQTGILSLVSAADNHAPAIWKYAYKGSACVQLRVRATPERYQDRMLPDPRTLPPGQQAELEQELRRMPATLHLVAGYTDVGEAVHTVQLLRRYAQAHPSTQFWQAWVQGVPGAGPVPEYDVPPDAPALPAYVDGRMYEQGRRCLDEISYREIQTLWRQFVRWRLEETQTPGWFFQEFISPRDIFNACWYWSDTSDALRRKLNQICDLRLANVDYSIDPAHAAGMPDVGSALPWGVALGLGAGLILALWIQR